MKENEEDNTEDNTEENVEETLGKEFSLTNTQSDRATDEQMINSIKANLCTCNICGIKFIKRKTKVLCPICKSDDVS